MMWITTASIAIPAGRPLRKLRAAHPTRVMFAMPLSRRSGRRKIAALVCAARRSRGVASTPTARWRRRGLRRLALLPVLIVLLRQHRTQPEKLLQQVEPERRAERNQDRRQNHSEQPVVYPRPVDAAVRGERNQSAGPERHHDAPHVAVPRHQLHARLVLRRVYRYRRAARSDRGREIVTHRLRPFDLKLA